MIRFEPDSLGQALTRFFDMAAPDANVYVEIAAPDVRLAAVVILAVAALFCWRRLGAGRVPTLVMLLVLLASAGAWMVTSGNGRYFIPLLACAGPVAIGLLCLLPLSRGMKAAIAFGLVAAQLFVLTQQSPWNSWSWLDWKESPYFALDLGPEELQAPATTYATISTISYSLIAPRFPADSRWINLATSAATPREAKWADEFIRRGIAAGPVRLLAPSLPDATLADGRPDANILAAFDKLIADRHLRISGECHLIRSRGLARVAGREDRDAAHPVGFWSCPLAYEPNVTGGAVHVAAPAEVERVYEQLGVLCPRFFPPGEKATMRLMDGWERHYSSETRAYVLDNGQVWYKFWRSLNPVLIGNRDELVSGKVAVDCSKIRSDGAWRTGQP